MSDRKQDVSDEFEEPGTPHKPIHLIIQNISPEEVAIEAAFKKAVNKLFARHTKVIQSITSAPKESSQPGRTISGPWQRKLPNDVKSKRLEESQLDFLNQKKREEAIAALEVTKARLIGEIDEAEQKMNVGRTSIDIKLQTLQQELDGLAASAREKEVAAMVCEKRTALLQDSVNIFQGFKFARDIKD